MAALSTLAILGKAVGGMIGASNDAEAMREQAAFAKKQGESQARIYDIQAGDALRRGEQDQLAIGAQARQVKGAQRAGLAAQGIAVDTGSAADVQAETEKLSAQDVQRAKNNAWREAWGYRVQANQTRMGAQMASEAGNRAASNTLLTGGIRAASDVASGYYTYRKG
jgi:hypothetical protein